MCETRARPDWDAATFPAPASATRAASQKPQPSYVGAEVASLRTADSRTYLNTQGGFVADVSSAPINYRDGNGNWQPIDNTLKSSGGGYENAGNAYQLKLPSSLAAPVEVSEDGQTCSLQLVGASDGTAQVSGTTAKYPDALPGVDVSYSAENGGVKEAATLASASGPSVLVYTLSLSSGLSASLVGGTLRIRSQSGTFMALARPFARDAAGAASDTRMVLDRNADGSYTLTVEVAASWLASSDRKWPVVIDPSFSTDTSTFIQSGYPDDSYDGWDSMYVGYNGSGNTARGLVHFDLSALPHDVQVEHAQLELYLNSQAWCSSCAAQKIDVMQLTRSISGNATWNTSDGSTSWTNPGGDYDSAPVAVNSTVGPTVGQWELWQVSGPVRDWVEGSQANDGFLLKQDDESVTELAEFASALDEAGNVPNLWVTYQPRIGLRRLYTYRQFGLTAQMNMQVNVGNGNLVLADHDVTLQGVNGFDLNLTHYYNSLDANESGEGDDNPTGAAGAHWSIVPEGSIWSDGSVRLFEPSGDEVTFDSTPSGGWQQPDGIDAKVSTDTGSEGGDYVTYDSSGVKYQIGDPQSLDYTQDRNGNKWSYYADGAELTHIDDDTRGQTGRATFAYYSSNGLLHTMADTSGRTWTYGYDGNGNLTSDENARGDTVQFGYDGSHRLTTIVDARGDATDVVYDGSGRVQTITQGLDASGNCRSGDTCPQTQFSYPSPLDSTCSGVSGATGETIVTDARGNAWTYCYDNRLRVLKTTDPDGHSVSNDFTSAHGGSNCADDNPCSSTDALGNTSTFGYDDGSGQVQQGENQLWSQSPQEGTTNRPTFAYGSTSNSLYSVASSIDPQGNSWQFGYDASGNMTSKGEGSGAAPGQDPVSFAYNGDGTLKTATDAKGNVTSYGYTGHDLTSVTPPSPLGEITATYDALHRVSTVTDGNGVTRTYHYDGDDRVKEIDFSSGPTLTFSYDAAGNLSSESDSTGTYTYHYDNLNQLVEEDQPGSKVIRYSYDANGNIASVSDVNGDVTAYAYDKENLLSSLTEPGMSTAISFGYDADGDRTLIAYPDGVDECAVYDASGRITEVSGFAASGTPDCSSPSSWPSSRLTDFTYSYARAGSDTDLRWASTSRYGSGTVSSLYYCYDPLNRLASLANSAGCPSSASSTSSGPYWGAAGAPDQYVYDVNGNMTSMTEGGTTRSFSFNAANETSGSGFSYDQMGNETADPGVFVSASYNQLEQMSSVTPTGGPAVAMSYQGLGQALRVSHGSVSQVEDQLGLELESGSSAASFTRDADGTILGEETGGSRYYFLFDANGSVVTVVDSLGVVADTFRYSPYGTTTSSAGSVYEPIRFDGGYDDTAAGGESLVKFGERYYDPSTGRWISQDPDNNPLTTEGWNQYDYAGDDSINNLDPAGLCLIGTCWIKHAAHYVVHHPLRIISCAALGLAVASGVGELGLTAVEVGTEVAEESGTVERVVAGAKAAYRAQRSTRGTLLTGSSAGGFIVSTATGGCL